MAAERILVLDTWFPWIGLVAAAVLLVLLSMDSLRADLRVPRRHDLSWLSWAGVAAYLIHNVEEYGLDLHGQAYAFPKAFCGMFGYAALYPQCPVPGEVFTAVNIPMFWLAAPLGAWMSRRYRFMGLAIYSVIAVNLAAHVGRTLVSGGQYNPGLLTAILIFLPLAGWTLIGTGALTRRELATVVGIGVMVHAILIFGMLLLITGVVREPGVVVVLQSLNAGVLILATFAAEKMGLRQR
nr:HXXEE domain-containing protein [uncultured Sphingomonas sp.]